MRAAAPGIVVAAPDLIVTSSTQYTEIFKRLTNTIPIDIDVHVCGRSRWGTGLVVSAAHPGGNITGFSQNQFSLAGKWLTILKDLVPGMGHVMALYEPANPNWRGYSPVLESAASSLGVTIYPAPAATMADVEGRIEAFARDPGGGMIVILTPLTVGNAETIATLAARHRLPAIHSVKSFVTGGGLVSYGADVEDQTRRAAQYADRILKGEKPAELPVQAPTKFELVINAKTAKTLGLTIPTKLLALADEVIE